MSEITVNKVFNTGLKLTDGKVIPVIRVVLSDYAGEHTLQEIQNMMLSIYNLSMGCVTACAYHFNDLLNPHFINIRDGSWDWGDDTGFELIMTASSYDETLVKSQTIELQLNYKGDRLSTAHVYTGYSDYEYGYLMIFTDEDYNLLYFENSVIEGFQIRSDYDLGIAIKNGVPVCGIWEDGEYNYGGGAYTIIGGTDNIKDDISQEIDPEPTDDPYEPGGTSTGDGGDGDHDDDDDPIDVPSLPTLSAVDTGFIRLFNPSIQQLQALAAYMWTGPFDPTNFRKVFADPMDCILGLSIVPVAVPGGGTKVVTVGNISTGISMTIAARQYVEVDCGSLNINEYWGAYLDYEPYTKAEIYLPYIGTHPISIDDIMKKTVHVVYHVDILSGSCTAYVKCGSSVLYSFIGQCASSIPISGNDWTNVINGALSIATAIGSMVATGGATAPMAAPTIASTAVNNMKPSIEKSGSMSGTGGLMAVQKPYIILTRPRQALPAAQNSYMGYPSFITSYLGVISGYTEIEHIHLDGISATDDELNEIEKLLKSGVIL